MKLPMAIAITGALLALPLILVGGCGRSDTTLVHGIMNEGQHTHYHIHGVDASHEHSHSQKLGAHTHTHSHKHPAKN
jgi:hypothetical protein